MLPDVLTSHERMDQDLFNQVSSEYNAFAYSTLSINSETPLVLHTSYEDHYKSLMKNQSQLIDIIPQESYPEEAVASDGVASFGTGYPPHVNSDDDDSCFDECASHCSERSFTLDWNWLTEDIIGEWESPDQSSTFWDHDFEYLDSEPSQPEPRSRYPPGPSPLSNEIIPEPQPKSSKLRKRRSPPVYNVKPAVDKESIFYHLLKGRAIARLNGWDIPELENVVLEKDNLDALTAMSRRIIPPRERLSAPPCLREYTYATCAVGEHLLQTPLITGDVFVPSDVAPRANIVRETLTTIPQPHSLQYSLKIVLGEGKNSREYAAMLYTDPVAMADWHLHVDKIKVLPNKDVTTADVIYGNIEL